MWLIMFVSEKYQIVRRIKDFVKDKELDGGFYIMLRNGNTLRFDDYRDMVKAGKITPQDTYIHINIKRVTFKADFYYPFIAWYNDILFAYLSKLGFYYGYSIFPATGLKYIADVEHYNNYLSIELVELDTTVNNTNLPKIVFEVVGEKIISGEKELTDGELNKIIKMSSSQRLFANHNNDEARFIIINYYGEDNQSLKKEVTHIAMDYYRIFHPYTVCYDTKTWKEIDCLSIKL